MSTIAAEAVCLHPLAPGDAETVLEVFAGLGPRSRERRFLAAKPRLAESDLQQLTAVDGHDHVALVAWSDHDHRPVGIARFVRDPVAPEAADVAVSVVDAWQGQGIGTMLLDALLRRAAELGVRRLTLVTAPDNRAVLRLLDRAPGTVSRLHAGRGATEYAVSLGEAAP
jgi:RimJ/RimL family protein N-acetyltransferase